MDSKNPLSYGVKSLIECTSRTTILSQPDDIPRCLETHLTQMTQFGGADLTNNEVAFRYQEQWEYDFLRQINKRQDPHEKTSSTSTIRPSTSTTVSVIESNTKVISASAASPRTLTTITVSGTEKMCGPVPLPEVSVFNTEDQPGSMREGISISHNPETVHSSTSTKYMSTPEPTTCADLTNIQERPETAGSESPVSTLSRSSNVSVTLSTVREMAGPRSLYQSQEISGSVSPFAETPSSDTEDISKLESSTDISGSGPNTENKSSVSRRGSDIVIKINTKQENQETARSDSSLSSISSSSTLSVIVNVTGEISRPASLTQSHEEVHVSDAGRLSRSMQSPREDIPSSFTEDKSAVRTVPINTDEIRPLVQQPHGEIAVFDGEDTCDALQNMSALVPSIENTSTPLLVVENDESPESQAATAKELSPMTLSYSHEEIHGSDTEDTSGLGTLPHSHEEVHVSEAEIIHELASLTQSHEEINVSETENIHDPASLTQSHEEINVSETENIHDPASLTQSHEEINVSETEDILGPTSLMKSHEEIHAFETKDIPEPASSTHEEILVSETETITRPPSLTKSYDEIRVSDTEDIYGPESLPLEQSHVSDAEDTPRPLSHREIHVSYSEGTFESDVSLSTPRPCEELSLSNTEPVTGPPSNRDMSRVAIAEDVSTLQPSTVEFDLSIRINKRPTPGDDSPISAVSSASALSLTVNITGEISGSVLQSHGEIITRPLMLPREDMCLFEPADPPEPKPITANVLESVPQLHKDDICELPQHTEKTAEVPITEVEEDECPILGVSGSPHVAEDIAGPPSMPPSQEETYVFDTDNILAPVSLPPSHEEIHVSDIDDMSAPVSPPPSLRDLHVSDIEDINTPASLPQSHVSDTEAISEPEPSARDRPDLLSQPSQEIYVSEPDQKLIQIKEISRSGPITEDTCDVMPSKLLEYDLSIKINKRQETKQTQWDDSPSSSTSTLSVIVSKTEEISGTGSMMQSKQEIHVSDTQEIYRPEPPPLVYSDTDDVLEKGLSRSMPIPEDVPSPRPVPYVGSDILIKINKRQESQETFGDDPPSLPVSSSSTLSVTVSKTKEISEVQSHEEIHESDIDGKCGLMLSQNEGIFSPDTKDIYQPPKSTDNVPVPVHVAEDISTPMTCMESDIIIQINTRKENQETEGEETTLSNIPSLSTVSVTVSKTEGLQSDEQIRRSDTDSTSRVDHIPSLDKEAISAPVPNRDDVLRPVPQPQNNITISNKENGAGPVAVVDISSPSTYVESDILIKVNKTQETFETTIEDSPMSAVSSSSTVSLVVNKTDELSGPASLPHSHGQIHMSETVDISRPSHEEVPLPAAVGVSERVPNTDNTSRPVPNMEHIPEPVPPPHGEIVASDAVAVSDVPTTSLEYDVSIKINTRPETDETIAVVESPSYTVSSSFTLSVTMNDTEEIPGPSPYTCVEYDFMIKIDQSETTVEDCPMSTLSSTSMLSVSVSNTEDTSIPVLHLHQEVQVPDEDTRSSHRVETPEPVPSPPKESPVHEDLPEPEPISEDIFIPEPQEEPPVSDTEDPSMHASDREDSVESQESGSLNAEHLENIPVLSPHGEIAVSDSEPSLDNDLVETDIEDFEPEPVDMTGGTEDADADTENIDGQETGQNDIPEPVTSPSQDLNDSSSTMPTEDTSEPSLSPDFMEPEIQEPDEPPYKDVATSTSMPDIDDIDELLPLTPPPEEIPPEPPTIETKLIQCSIDSPLPPAPCKPDSAEMKSKPSKDPPKQLRLPPLSQKDASPKKDGLNVEKKKTLQSKPKQVLPPIPVKPAQKPANASGGLMKVKSKGIQTNLPPVPQKQERLLPPIPQKSAKPRSVRSELSKEEHKGLQNHKQRMLPPIMHRVSQKPKTKILHHKPKPPEKKLEPSRYQTMKKSDLHEVRAPYRPRGGMIVDRELTPLRFKGEADKSMLDFGGSRKANLSEMKKTIKVAQDSLESSTVQCPNCGHNAALIKCRHKELKYEAWGSLSGT